MGLPIQKPSGHFLQAFPGEDVKLPRGLVDGLCGFPVRLNDLLLAILVNFIFRSNTLRVCVVRVGGVQNHSFPFRQNQAKWTTVTHHHFIM